MSDSRNKPGGWAPAAGPGPEGWYEDPWNAKFQRFWDGKQWSGKTAPAGTHADGAGGTVVTQRLTNTPRTLLARLLAPKRVRPKLLRPAERR